MILPSLLPVCMSVCLRVNDVRRATLRKILLLTKTVSKCLMLKDKEDGAMFVRNAEQSIS